MNKVRICGNEFAKNLGNPFHVVSLQSSTAVSIIRCDAAVLFSRCLIIIFSSYFVIDLTSSFSDPMNAIAEFLSRFAHRITEVFGGEGVRIDVDVQSIIAMRTAGLRDNAQVEWIDTVLSQSLTYFIHLSIIQCPGPRENRRALPMSKRQFLACEYPGICIIIRHKYHVRCTSSHI